MGHKVHPTGFRLGINKNYKALWFAEGNTYKAQLKEDLQARKFLKEHLKQAGVGDIVIKRSLSNVSIDISVARPGIVIGKGGKGLEDLILLPLFSL
ncbi:KH domain-containing protein [Patescibacteria group bacterium]|nr:KH domain-containing protein [Patescibacteria group bacterium]